MIDVHVPQKSEHTWTDFFLHIATICVGLLIAIGLEQSVEAIHRAHERHDLREAFHRESQQILFDTEHTEIGLSAQLAFVRQLEQWVSDAQQSHHPLGQGPSRPHGIDFDVPDEPIFKAAKASGKISLLSDDEVVAYGEMDTLVNQVTVNRQAFILANDNVTTFVRGMAFGHPPGNPLANASSADLKQFYADLVAMEQALLSSRFSSRQVHGCVIALLNGERDLRKIEASERQFDKLP